MKKLLISFVLVVPVLFWFDPPDFTTMLARQPATVNPAHAALMHLSDADRAAQLLAAVTAFGQSCYTVTYMFHQGTIDNGDELWNVACGNGHTYVVNVKAGEEGNASVVSCGMAKTVAGVECFTPISR